MSSRNPCSTVRCSCVSHGLHCVAACEDCRGTECINSAAPENENENIEFEDGDNIFEKLF